MRLYPRKLNSVAELRSERQMLRRQAKQADQEELFSFGPGHRKSNAADKKEEFHSGTGNNVSDYIAAFSDIMGARSVVDGAMAAAPLLMRLLPDAKVKKVLGRVVKEFAGGYLKWKAIEVGFRLAKRYINSRRQHRKETQKQH
jgi:hypothetical protein